MSTRGRILVVDDNAMNLKLARILLSAEGFDVEIAADARETEAVLRSFTPHVILMDLQMPDVDGLELTRRLKASAEHSSIPVVALTAAAMRADEERARAAGCDGFVSKPIDTRTLADVVARFLPADPVVA